MSRQATPRQIFDHLFELCLEDDDLFGILVYGLPDDRVIMLVELSMLVFPDSSRLAAIRAWSALMHRQKVLVANLRQEMN